MPNQENWNAMLNSEQAAGVFASLYQEDAETTRSQVMRYQKAIADYVGYFADGDLAVFNTPGRTEIGGNHTDHNAGRVLAASINLDAIAVAEKQNDFKVRLYSQGYDTLFEVDLKELFPRESEKETTESLIRGIAARFLELGYDVGGFSAYIMSDVMRGSGLSSSAAIEVLIGTIFNAFYNNAKITAETLAMIGQWSENHYFGKPCGLMDQVACAVGGIVQIDFRDNAAPIIESVAFDFASQNYRLIVVDTGGSHADLTDDYAAIPAEMKSIARLLNQSVCREVEMDDFLAHLPELRKKAGDRACLRAYHFLKENDRVTHQVNALKENQFKRFLQLIQESGRSSAQWLQNNFTCKMPEEQGVSLALAITEHFISDHGGACRVHGGGFAGTIQVFLPVDAVEEYKLLMTPVFGKNAVKVLNIRPEGTVNFASLIQN